jgi:hypothetical protein
VRTPLAVVVLIVCSATSAVAQDRPAPWAEVRGFASIATSINVNQPPSGTNQLRVFDFEDRRLKLDVAELVVQRPVTASGRLGFRSDLTTGGSIPLVTAASGMFRDAETGEATPGTFDVQQIFASYLAPLGSGLRIDAGKFTSHLGAEVIEGYDGYGDNYTRGFLFGYGEPGTLTGVRAGYTFNDQVSALVSISNGWDRVQDNNSGKTIGAQLAITPRDTLLVFVNYLGGPERSGSDLRHLTEVMAIAKPTASTTLTMSYDFAHDANAVEPGIDATWQGASAIAAFALGDTYGVAVRGEVFADPDGVRTGAAQTVAGVTVTPSINANQHLVLRSDLRLDRSTQQVFETRGGYARQQFTIAVNAIIVF